MNEMNNKTFLEEQMKILEKHMGEMIKLFKELKTES